MLLAGVVQLVFTSASLLAAQAPPPEYFLVPVNRWVVQVRTSPPAIEEEDARRLARCEERFRAALRDYRDARAGSPVRDFFRSAEGKALWREHREALIAVYTKAGLSPHKFQIDLANRSFVKCSAAPNLRSSR